MALLQTPLPSHLARLGSRVLDVVFPPLCLKCRVAVADNGNLCPECWLTIAFLDGPCCDCCGLPFEADLGPGTVCGGCLARPPHYARARSVMRYEEASKALILAFKRADRLEFVPPFARWLERSGRGLLTECSLIVPVPLHPLRLWQRRYNQSALLAAALARASGKPWMPELLRRRRATPSQGTMTSAKARRRNVTGAFRVEARHRPVLKGRTVLLVDDVMTTGATLDACARALRRAGAATVLAVTLARVVRPLTDPI